MCLPFLAGCMIKSYPAETLKEDLKKICKKEYGVEEIDVKIVDNTIGVYLPLKKLFATDFKEAAVSGKVRNLETLFEPSEQALEKVEDVLFSISRVLLSTDIELEFYVLQATDIEKTGLQLVLSGYVDDIRRVRIWDISRGEYRKRVVHELRLNRAVRWHQPVRAFFDSLPVLDVEKIRNLYFHNLLPAGAIQTLFLNLLLEPGQQGPAMEWDILEIRSAPFQNNEVLVYTKVLPHEPKKDAAGENVPAAERVYPVLSYLFMFAFSEDKAELLRIIPFQYQDEMGEIQKIPFPVELQIEENLDSWEEEFRVEPLEIGPFLADQLTRRVQAILSMDERIQNTFRGVQLEFQYVREPEPAHFSLNIEASLRDFNNYKRDSIVFHEDMLYLLNIVSREFVEVLRSYRFGDFDYLSLEVAQEPSPMLLWREDLELFRKGKMQFQGMLSLTSQM